MKRPLFLLLCAAGCDQAMRDQPKVEPLEGSAFFADGAGARPLPPGTVPRGGLRGEAVDARRTAFPFPVSRADLARGRERYGVACAICHGAGGDGDGLVVRRGFPAPPSFHEDRLRDATAGHLVSVIRDGLGRMPPHGYLVAPDDRWRIAAYVRALQLSRRVPVERLRPEERARLGAEDP